MEIKFQSFFVLSQPLHITTITTIFNFNEFVFVYIINIRFICDGEIYLLNIKPGSDLDKNASTAGLCLSAVTFIKINFAVKPLENLFVVKDVLFNIRCCPNNFH